MSLRGTEVAIHDYAFFNEKILGNKSIVLYDKNHKQNHPLVIDKFIKSGIDLRPVDGFGEVDAVIESEKCDYLYTIKACGAEDGRLSKICKNVVHMTGLVSMDRAHGDVFAYVSETLSQKVNGPILSQSTKIVPHMINLPQNIYENFRKEWNIPENAFVIGRTGGTDTWDIPFVNQCIKFALDNRPNLYFCAQNTIIPFAHKKLIHVPQMADLVEKTKFINTCDAMIHARSYGETFGIAIGEFSVRCKRIIVGDVDHPDKVNHHLTVLKDKVLIYRNFTDLLNILFTIQSPKTQSEIDDLNCYKQYNPEAVMKIFDEIFLI